MERFITRWSIVGAELLCALIVFKVSQNYNHDRHAQGLSLVVFGVFIVSLELVRGILLVPKPEPLETPVFSQEQDETHETEHRLSKKSLKRRRGKHKKKKGKKKNSSSHDET